MQEPFDLVIDTTATTRDELAGKIKRRLADGPAPTAFRQLRTAALLRDIESYGPGMSPSSILTRPAKSP